MKRCGMILIFWVLLADAGRRRRHRQIRIDINEVYGMSAQLSIGTPPQNVRAMIDTRFSETIIMDAVCNNPRSEALCPKYCDDAVLWPLYCSPMCEPVTAAIRRVRCGGRILRQLNTSESLVNLDLNTGFRLRGTRPFFGRNARERLEMTAPRYDKALKLIYRTIYMSKELISLRGESIEFVRGYSFDVRMLKLLAQGIMGLSPPPSPDRSSLPVQLVALGYADVTRLSIQNNLPPIFSTAFAYPSSSITIGALDKFSCHNWQLLPAHGRVGWTFAMEDVIFSGYRIEGPNFGRISLDTQEMRIPEAVAKQMIASGFMYRDDGYLRVHYENESLVELGFAVGNQKIHMDSETLTDTFTMFMSNGDNRYNDEVQWAFGAALFEYFCFGYDYDNGAVAWGDRRRIPKDWKVK